MKRSKFSLSNYKLLSGDLGKLIPVGLTEVLPGDTIQQATSALIRSQPLLAPVMHPVHVTIHHWFVPHRIIWDDWENFITGGPDGDDASVFPTITFTSGGGLAAVGSLADYLGVPPAATSIEVSALPFRAYALIWNEWYRDQDLQTALTIDTTSGADTTTNVALQNVCWEKDYFTTSRVDPQKGPEITLPLGLTAPVKGFGKLNQNFNTAAQAVYETDGSGTTVYADSAVINNASADERFYVEEDPDHAGYPGIFADLSAATAVSVNTVREAFALQRFEEARARYGSRYTEYLRYLGVRSSDARLQRPEYLGGGKQTIQFSEVLQTAPNATDGDTGNVGVGALKGHGIGALRSNRYRKFFEEHGYVITCISVRPKTVYVEGLARTWNRRTKEDFWQKELQTIGQQEVLFKELSGYSATPNSTFGYQDRYDEYRRTESSVAGEFRTSTLDYWHYGRVFDGSLGLNSAFVSCVPTTRVLASTATDPLIMMVNHSIQARRLVSKQGNSLTF